MRTHGMETHLLERAGIHRRAPDPVCAFFVEVIRKYPWIRVRVRDDPLDDMQVAFSVKTSFPPTRFRWDFGDGHGSADPAPEHEYARPGLYTVRVALWVSDDQYDTRRVQLQVPRIRIGARSPTSTPAP